MQFYESNSGIPEERRHYLRLLGTGASSPTLDGGNGLNQGITAARQSAGVVRITWTQDNPGRFVNLGGPCFGGATSTEAAALKGETLTRGTFVAATATTQAYIDLYIWNSAGSADDLAAGEYVDLCFTFSVVSSTAAY